MKSSLVILAAASVPLLLNTPRASAGEVPFNVPVTDRAQQAQELLSRAAYALDAEVQARVGRDRKARLSNLWIYPTNDVETVFAHYTLTPNDPESAGLSSAQHLALITLRGNRIVSLQDLTSASDQSEQAGEEVAARVSDARNWSATIGDGHTSNVSHFALTPSQGAPASPHWSASIGTGQAANASPSEPAKFPVVATSTSGHWASRIGTGRAAPSDAETNKRRI